MQSYVGDYFLSRFRDFLELQPHGDDKTLGKKGYFPKCQTILLRCKKCVQPLKHLPVCMCVCVSFVVMLFYHLVIFCGKYVLLRHMICTNQDSYDRYFNISDRGVRESKNTHTWTYFLSNILYLITPSWFQVIYARLAKNHHSFNIPNILLQYLIW